MNKGKEMNFLNSHNGQEYNNNGKGKYYLDLKEQRQSV